MSASERPPNTRYRHDIDGLRAIAVLLVVAYHVWLDRVSGGVDAFLMISAFFLTGTFMRRLEAGAPLRIAGQWARTFKRLLPAAVTVIALTVVLGTLLLPRAGHTDLWRHAWASLFYYENWLLAAESVDYYADTSLASPLQHFWSLSVQGQVFLLWPLLFGAIALLRRLLKVTRVAPLAAGCFGVVFAGSLTYSIAVTAAHQESAYFNTGARLWEFAAGSLLAIGLPYLKLSPILSAVLGWLGIAALLSCGLVLDVQGGFPGYLALWPVLSVAAIIVSGSNESRRASPARLLELKPVLALGKDAYSLYLVHWPLLVMVLVSRRGASLNFIEGLALILVAIALARLLSWGVDGPVRRWKWADSKVWHGFAVIGACLALVALPLFAVQQVAANEARKIAGYSEAEKLQRNPGAAVLMAGWSGEIDPKAPMLPLATELDREWGSLPEPCGAEWSAFFNEAVLKGCSTRPADDPELTVVLVGDSHPEQWLAPLERVAADRSWHVAALLRGGCTFGLWDADAEEVEYYDEEWGWVTGAVAPEGIGVGEECLQWSYDVVAGLEELQPDVVIAMGTAAHATDSTLEADAGEREEVRAGMAPAIERLRAAGISTVLLRDNPRFTFDSFVCVEQVSNADECGVSLSRALASANPADALAGPGVATVDMTDLICPSGVCSPVIGNVAVYLDDNHLTSAYTATTRPVFERRLIAAIREAAQ